MPSVTRSFSFDHHAGRMLAIVVIDELAEVIRVRQLIAPVAGGRNIRRRIDDPLYVICVIPTPFTWFVGTHFRAELRIVVVYRLREYGRRVDGDVSTGKHAADGLSTLVAKHIPLQLRRESLPGAIGAVVGQMKLSLVAIPGILQPRYLWHLAFNTDA